MILGRSLGRGFGDREKTTGPRTCILDPVFLEPVREGQIRNCQFSRCAGIGGSPNSSAEERPVEIP